MTAADLKTIELFAWLGEDELGSGEIGLKQGLVPAGYIPLVAVNRAKMENQRELMERQSAVFGKRIRLCRFIFAEVLLETAAGE